MPVLNLADDLKVGADQVDAAFIELTQVWPGGLTPVDPGPAWLDLDERELDGATFAYGESGSDVDSLRLSVGHQFSTAGTFDIGIGAPFSQTITLAYDIQVAAVVAAIEAVTGVGTVTWSSATVGPSSFPLESFYLSVFTWAGVLAGAGPICTLDVSNLVQPLGPGLTPFGGGIITLWPNQGTGGAEGDAIIDPDDGSTDLQGFVASVENNHPTIIADYDPGDSRMTVPVDWDSESFLTLPGEPWGIAAADGFATVTDTDYSTGGTWDLLIGAPFSDTATIAYNATVADLIAAVEAITGLGTLVPGEDLHNGNPVELSDRVEDNYVGTMLWSGALEGAGPTCTADLTNLVQGSGPGLVEIAQSGTLPDNYAEFVDVTFVYMVTIGTDGDLDGSEWCPLTFHVADEYYEDMYVYEDDRESSNIAGYEFGHQMGGPQPGDTIIVTKVHRYSQYGDGPSAALVPSLSHIDGFEVYAAEPNQTTFINGSGDVYPGDGYAPGVMLLNYPGGDYAVPCQVHRVMMWRDAAGGLSAAERLFVREMLRDQAAADGRTVTLYDESVPPVLDVIVGVWHDWDPSGAALHATGDDVDSIDNTGVAPGAPPLLTPVLAPLADVAATINGLQGVRNPSAADDRRMEADNGPVLLDSRCWMQSVLRFDDDPATAAGSIVNFYEGMNMGCQQSGGALMDAQVFGLDLTEYVEVDVPVLMTWGWDGSNIIVRINGVEVHDAPYGGSQFTLLEQCLICYKAVVTFGQQRVLGLDVDIDIEDAAMMTKWGIV